MADTCIVCLGDLRTEDPPPPEAADLATTASPSTSDAKRATRATAKSIDADEESIAHLLPCKHDLHNACLKPWVERANSCPICRATFNIVELSLSVGGPVLDSYAVQDKVQEAELDPGMIVEEDELFAVEEWDPCAVCGDSNETHEMMYCDGCAKIVHVFCAGYQEAPDTWYCETCFADMEADIGLPGLTAAVRRPRRRAGVAAVQRGRGRALRDNDAIWARVWGEVSRRLDLDLDFPFDDENVDAPIARRGRTQWNQRMRVARDTGGQAATERLRDIAEGNLLQRQPEVQLEPESQEEIRAWNAFDKARESQEAPQNVRRRKRKATASPVSPNEPTTNEQPQQKRPRLRRRPDPPAISTSGVAESSHAAAQRYTDEQRSTFLNSLLKDVETKPLQAGSPATSVDQYAGQWSPRDSSPMRSPTSSGHATPRATSPTPPPQQQPPPQQPISPPLSASAAPAGLAEGALFSPFSPTSVHPTYNLHHRGRQRPLQNVRRGSEDSLTHRAMSSSPTRGLSYSAKEEIQRMVKTALAPRYRDKEISKEQYTDINRDVSRSMYELVGDASALANQTERERWQEVAEEQVKEAISVMHFGLRDVVEFSS